MHGQLLNFLLKNVYTSLQKVEHENVTDIIEIKTPSPVLTLICKRIRLAIDQTQEKLYFMDMNRKS